MFKPIQPAVGLDEDATIPVHFAYSITVLHQSCVIHCVIPGIPWTQAKTIRPVFTLHSITCPLLQPMEKLTIAHFFSDEHMLVYVPGISTHLLDIGVLHEPSCHITLTAELPSNLSPAGVKLVSILKTEGCKVLNLATLDVIDLSISEAQLVGMFKSETSFQNKLSILHYFLVHEGDSDIATEVRTHF